MNSVLIPPSFIVNENLIEMVFNKGGQAMTDSRRVAKYFDREHKNVLQSIYNMDCSVEFRRLNFQPSSYINSQGKEQEECLLTEKGCTFLIMGFIGSKAAEIKEKYIEAFEKMNDALSGRYNISINPLVISARDKVLIQGAALEFANINMKFANLLGASSSLGRAHTVQAVSREFNVDLKALLAENISDTQTINCTPTELGKFFNPIVSAYYINKLLKDNGLQTKEGKQWELTEEGKKYGVYLDVGKKHSNGTPIKQVKWNKDLVFPLIKDTTY